MSRAARHCDSREEAWFDHVQELRWANECEYECKNESKNECEDEYVSEYGVEEQEEECSAEELAIFEEAWFNHVQENSWTSGCENEDQEQEEYAYRHLDFLGESFAVDISSSNTPCAPATKMEVVEEDQDAADMKARLFAAEMRVMQLESQLLTAKAVAARDLLRTQELEGLFEKQKEQIDKLTESLDIMTEWIIEIKQPETTSCL
jgi:hypothetical protein